MKSNLSSNKQASTIPKRPWEQKQTSSSSSSSSSSASSSSLSNAKSKVENAVDVNASKNNNNNNNSDNPNAPAADGGAPHSQSFIEIMQMVQRGETPTGIRSDIIDKPIDPNKPIPAGVKTSAKKPWQK